MMRPGITFFIGEERFAADAEDVAEVFQRPVITRVPRAPSALVGIASLRWAATPVISFARLVGRDNPDSIETTVLLLSGQQPIGLRVERVGALAPLPVPLGDGREQRAGRLYALEGDTLRPVDLDGLLSASLAYRGAGGRRHSIGPEQSPASSEVQVEVALLSFDVAGQTYALPLEDVSEVLRLPGHLKGSAAVGAAVIGEHEYRGQRLDVLSLQSLLGLNVRRAEAARIVVVRQGDRCLGFAVDTLGAILRVSQTTIDPAPPVLNRGAGQAHVESVCRLADGRGLVAVLATAALFGAERFAPVLADEDVEVTRLQKAPARVKERYLIIRIGAEHYGVPLAAVDEVVNVRGELVRVPGAPGFVDGVINVRGRVTPVIDQRRRFEADPAATPPRLRVVVTTIDGHPLGFIVDAVSEILDLAVEEIEPPPEFTGGAARVFGGVTSLDGKMVLLIDPHELLDRAERDLLGRMASQPLAQP